MVKIVLKKLSKLKNHSSDRYFADFAHREVLSTDEVATRIQASSTLKKADVLAVITELGDLICEQMAQGNSVKLEGLGIFSPSLKLDGVEEVKRQGSDSAYLRTKNVHIDRVRFKVQNDVLEAANHAFAPARDTDDGVVVPTTELSEVGERKELVRKYLMTSPVMTIQNYMNITNLRRTNATNELKAWATGPDAFLEDIGAGTKHLYHLK